MRKEARRWAAPSLITTWAQAECTSPGMKPKTRSSTSSMPASAVPYRACHCTASRPLTATSVRVCSSLSRVPRASPCSGSLVEVSAGGGFVGAKGEAVHAGSSHRAPAPYPSSADSKSVRLSVRPNATAPKPAMSAASTGGSRRTQATAAGACWRNVRLCASSQLIWSTAMPQAQGASVLQWALLALLWLCDHHRASSAQGLIQSMRAALWPQAVAAAVWAAVCRSASRLSGLCASASVAQQKAIWLTTENWPTAEASNSLSRNSANRPCAPSDTTLPSAANRLVDDSRVRSFMAAHSPKACHKGNDCNCASQLRWRRCCR